MPDRLLTRLCTKPPTAKGCGEALEDVPQSAANVDLLALRNGRWEWRNLQTLLRLCEKPAGLLGILLRLADSVLRFLQVVLGPLVGQLGLRGQAQCLVQGQTWLNLPSLL